VYVASTSPPKLSVVDQHMQQHLQHDTCNSDLMWNSTDDGQEESRLLKDKID
jgi:hypothetical protein